MLTINKSYTGFNLSMPIAQSKRKLIAATALFIAVGALTGAIATGGATTISFAQTEDQTGGGGGGAATGQQGGGESRILRQGVATSQQDPLPGHEEHQEITILPLREDGSVYSGVLTYTATQPVEVVVLDVLQLNATERSILNATEDGFGTLLTSPLDNQTTLGITVITPPYGDTPIPSASIPFAGNGLWLHTLSGEPFAASYAVSAQVLPGEIQNHISNVTLALAGGAAEEEEEDGGAAADEDGGGAAADEDGGGAAADEDGGGAAEDEGGAAEGGAADEEAEGGTTADGGGTTGA
jgi:hypothetical protein